MPYDFFHAITDRDSAEIRRYLTTHDLTSLVSFRNISYDTHAEALRALTGSSDVPVLALEDGRILKEKNEILAFLREQAR